MEDANIQFLREEESRQMRDDIKSERIERLSKELFEDRHPDPEWLEIYLYDEIPHSDAGEKFIKLTVAACFSKAMDALLEGYKNWLTTICLEDARKIVEGE